jgi:hypothetical protein
MLGSAGNARNCENFCVERRAPTRTFSYLRRRADVSGDSQAIWSSVATCDACRSTLQKSTRKPFCWSSMMSALSALLLATSPATERERVKEHAAADTWLLPVHVGARQPHDAAERDPLVEMVEAAPECRPLSAQRGETLVHRRLGAMKRHFLLLLPT